MSPSFTAFSDELMKLAKEEKPSAPPFKKMLKNRFLRTAPQVALGAGLGAGSAMLLGHATRPLMLKHMGPRGAKATMGAITALGLLGGLAYSQLMHEAAKEDLRD